MLASHCPSSRFERSSIMCSLRITNWQIWSNYVVTVPDEYDNIFLKKTGLRSSTWQPSQIALCFWKFMYVCDSINTVYVDVIMLVFCIKCWSPWTKCHFLCDSTVANLSFSNCANYIHLGAWNTKLLSHEINNTSAILNLVGRGYGFSVDFDYVSFCHFVENRNLLSVCQQIVCTHLLMSP